MDTVRDIVETVLISLLIAVLVRTFVVERFLVDGPCMEPTFWTGESLLVWKLAYKFGGSPKRGDIVVFKYPLGPEKDYTKRVVAIGGDSIEMRLGRVYINGQQVQEPFVTYPGLYDTKAITVPEGSVFVMGDHRTNSEDSRTFGPVKLKDVKGKAVLIVWPPKNAGFIKQGRE